MAKRVFLTLTVVLILALVIAVVWITNLIRQSLPHLDGEIVVAGLENPVEVTRDNYGIPHIRAQSELDLYYALGFVNAQDRLWQLDLFRRLSQGRLAEIFGPTVIPLDYRHRVLGFQRLGEKLYAQAEENSKAICRAYADGINHCIKMSPGRLPIEFRLLRYKPESWSPEDVYAVLMWQQWMVTFNWETELGLTALVQSIGEDDVLDLIRIADQGGPTIIPESEKQYAPSPSRIDDMVFPSEKDFMRIKFLNDASSEEKPGDSVNAWLGPRSEVYASNCWVVSGARSESGKPILANDPHIPHTLPSIWYMVHLSAPGIDDAAGIMTIGVPMIVMGHTRHIAWGDTTTGADTQDLYIEKLNPENSNEYLYKGGYRAFDARKEIIHYREDGQMKAVEKEIRSSIHGPIINEIADPQVHPDTPLALRWAGYEPSDMIKAGSMMIKATNWEEFCEALKHVVTPVWNWVYADRNGNIGYQVTGYVPIRQKGRGLAPVPGWLEEYEWDGFIPYEEMPRLYNPSNGYIVTANNKVAPEDYPYLIATRFMPPGRAARIEERLLAHEKLTVKEMERIQMDVYSKQGEHMRDRFVAACEKHPQSVPDFNEAVGILRDWDLNAGPESAGASIFYESHASAARKIVKNRLKQQLWRKIYRSIGSLDNMIDDESAQIWFDDPSTETVETRDMLLSASVAEAAISLRELFRDGPPAWKWGGTHTLTFKHPLGRSGLLAKFLNVGPFRMGGANFTVNPANYFFDETEKPYPVFAGPSMRTVVDFADVDATRMGITLGQSGSRFSPHYADHLPLWLKGESPPMTPNGIMEPADMAGTHIEGRLILKPAG